MMMMIRLTRRGPDLIALEIRHARQADVAVYDGGVDLADDVMGDVRGQERCSQPGVTAALFGDGGELVG